MVALRFENVVERRGTPQGGGGNNAHVCAMRCLPACKEVGVPVLYIGGFCFVW